MKGKDFSFKQAKEDSVETILNFGLVFRGKLETFDDVKKTILEAGDVLIYQTKSIEKIWIAKSEKEAKEK